MDFLDIVIWVCCHLQSYLFGIWCILISWTECTEKNSFTFLFSCPKLCNNKINIIIYIIIFEYFQFKNILESTPGKHSMYLNEFVTVFAPSNDAILNYRSAVNEDFILTHFGEWKVLIVV